MELVLHRKEYSTKKNCVSSTMRAYGTIFLVDAAIRTNAGWTSKNLPILALGKIDTYHPKS